jgi:hypothetical protein
MKRGEERQSVTEVDRQTDRQTGRHTERKTREIEKAKREIDIEERAKRGGGEMDHEMT